MMVAQPGRQIYGNCGPTESDKLLLNVVWSQCLAYTEEGIYGKDPRMFFKFLGSLGKY